MKKLSILFTFLFLAGLSAYAQLEDKKWLLNGSLNFSALNLEDNNFSGLSTNLFLGKILSRNQVIAFGGSHTFNFNTDFDQTLTSQNYFIEYQKVKELSSEIPISMFFAPRIQGQLALIDLYSVGVGFSWGLMYRLSDQWLITARPISVAANFGTQSSVSTRLGGGGIGFSWLPGK